MNKNHYFILAIIALFLSCEQNSPMSVGKKNTDSTITDTNKIAQAMTTDIDTSGLSQAPIKILKSSMKVQLIDTVDNPEDNLHHEGHFKRFVNIKITYKNVSSKRIIGAQLKWLMLDKNGNPAIIEHNQAGIGLATMGTLASSNLYGFTFGIGKTNTDEWQQGCPAGTKVKLVYASKVEFYDNSIWRIGKK